MAFKGNSKGESTLVYLHPELPCAGVRDGLEIEGSIADDFLYKKFKEMYGVPKLDDYDRLELLEKEIKWGKEQLSHPVIKFLLKFFKPS